ncbi:MAG TPA: hypothetical protein VF381_10320 [Thermoanaerobaculia bacterium]
MLVALGTLLLTGSAFAQASRTWVSGVGDDANPCSRTAPCKTFAGAISKTAVCGEIDALDPAGFGAVTITKSITIDGGGNHASVLVAGTNAIVIQISTDTCGQTVILRNLQINGIGTGINAIRLQGSNVTNLHLEHLDIQRFTTRGVDISPTVAGDQVFMRDVDIRNTGGDSIGVSPGANLTTKVSIHDVRGRQSAADGFHCVNDTVGTIHDSEFQGNNTGIALDVASCHMGMVDTVVSENASNGLQVSGGVTTFIDHLSAMRNGTGVANFGTVNSFGNSAVANNTTADVSPNAIATLPHP